MSKFSANAAVNALSTAFLFKKGLDPGSPRHTGQVCALGTSVFPVGQAQKSFVRVLRVTWVSRPIFIFCGSVGCVMMECTSSAVVFFLSWFFLKRSVLRLSPARTGRFFLLPIWRFMLFLLLRPSHPTCFLWLFSIFFRCFFGFPSFLSIFFLRVSFVPFP